MYVCMHVCTYVCMYVCMYNVCVMYIYDTNITIKNFLETFILLHLYWRQNTFFNCYLAAPRSTLGHYGGGSLTHPMLITAFLHIWPERHRELRNEVGFLSPAERLVGLETRTFRFWLEHLNPLNHSPHTYIQSCKLWYVTYKCIKKYLRRNLTFDWPPEISLLQKNE